MRKLDLLDRQYQVLIDADGPDAVVGRVSHVIRNASGGQQHTPVAHFDAYRHPAAEVFRKHWSVQLFIRNKFRLHGTFPKALGELLLAETSCEMPAVLHVYKFENASFVEFGEVWLPD